MEFLITVIIAVVLLVGVVSSCPSVCSCTDEYNGVNVHCQSRGLDSIPTDLPNNTIKFDLYNNEITAIQSGTFNNLTRLTTLNLYINQIKSIQPGTFNDLTSLTHLKLYNNKIPSIQSGTFNDLTSLTHLDLHDNKITSIQSGTFNNLTRLTTLHLSYNQITSIQLGIFNDLTSLTYIYLYSSKITSIQSGTFNNLTRLTRLRMENNLIAFVSEKAFVNLPQLPLLEFDMHCGSCENIPFWRWLKGNHTFNTSITCNDFDREHLSNVQLNTFTDCFKCNLGYYGYNCNISCEGCLSDSCDSEYGICADTSGCKPGWQPRQSKCDIACSKGHFGNNCNHTCDGCISELCNHVDGVCDITDQCKAGLDSVKCDKAATKSDDNNTAVYTGAGTFAATALVAVIIVLVTLRSRKKNRQQRRQTVSEFDSVSYIGDRNTGTHHAEAHIVDSSMEELEQSNAEFDIVDSSTVELE